MRWQTERPDPRHGCCGYDVTSGLERRWCHVPGERFGHLAGKRSPRFKFELDDAKDREGWEKGASRCSAQVEVGLLTVCSILAETG